MSYVYSRDNIKEFSKKFEMNQIEINSLLKALNYVEYSGIISVAKERGIELDQYIPSLRQKISSSNYLKLSNKETQLLVFSVNCYGNYLTQTNKDPETLQILTRISYMISDHINKDKKKAMNISSYVGQVIGSLGGAGLGAFLGLILGSVFPPLASVIIMAGAFIGSTAGIKAGYAAGNETGKKIGKQITKQYMYKR